MNLLKFALIFMGVLIIAGFGLLGYVMYQRSAAVGHLAKPATESETLDLGALGLVVAPSGPPVATALHLGSDARVEAIHDWSGRVLLLVRQPAIGDRLYLLDPRTGAVQSAIALGDTVPPLPAPPTPPARTAPAR